MSIRGTIESLNQGVETLRNPAKLLSNPDELAKAGIMPSGFEGSLNELSNQVTSGMKNLPGAVQQFKEGIDKLSASSDTKSPDAASTLAGSVSMVDTDGKKINLEQAAEGIALILGAFSKLFGKDTADQEASDEFDVDTNPSSLDRAITSGDAQAIRREARGYFERHPESGAAGYGLLGSPAKVTYENGKKMTWCAQSARLFADQFFGVKIPTVENAYKAEKQLYNSGQKLSIDGAVAFQKEKPGTIFHVFFDRPRDKGLSNPLGHAAIAYVDKWGTLRVYDPYLAPTGSAKGNARSEAYPLSQHQRISSARLYPISYDVSKIPPSVAQMVNTDGKNAPLPSRNNGEALNVKKSGDFEKLPNVTRRDIGEISRMTQAEAGKNNTAGQLRVAGVILNRLMSSEFPNTVEGVLRQKRGANSSLHQFSPMDDGRINNFSPDVNIVNQIIAMIESGNNPAKNALFFQAHNLAKTTWMDKNRTLLFSEGAGGHKFFA